MAPAGIRSTSGYGQVNGGFPAKIATQALGGQGPPIYWPVTPPVICGFRLRSYSSMTWQISSTRCILNAPRSSAGHPGTEGSIIRVPDRFFARFPSIFDTQPYCQRLRRTCYSRTPVKILKTQIFGAVYFAATGTKSARNRRPPSSGHPGTEGCIFRLPGRRRLPEPGIRTPPELYIGRPARQTRSAHLWGQSTFRRYSRPNRCSATHRECPLP